MNRPCKTCPFRRDSQSGACGGSDVSVFVAQTYAPFQVPCHIHIDYNDPDWRAKSVAAGAQQCVGHSVFRRKLDLEKYMPDELLKTPPSIADRLIFDSVREFVFHHTGKSIVDPMTYVIESVGNELHKLKQGIRNA